MDKSPLATLTLEDFLESERHKLTGTLTPVTPETFAKWKKERLDKKAAEAQALKAKEATGRAMFESGDWKDSEDESSDDDDDDDAQGAWNLESLRKETERLRAKKEAERLAKLNGELPPDPDQDNDSDEKSSQQDNDNNIDEDDNNNDDGGEGSSGGRS